MSRLRASLPLECDMAGVCVNLRLFPPSLARCSEKWSANPPIVKRPHSPLQSSDDPAPILRTGGRSALSDKFQMLIVAE